MEKQKKWGDLLLISDKEILRLFYAHGSKSIKLAKALNASYHFTCMRVIRAFNILFHRTELYRQYDDRGHVPLFLRQHQAEIKATLNKTAPNTTANAS